MTEDTRSGQPEAITRETTEAPYRIAVLSWFDVFTFDDPPVITCPDCDEPSPSLRDVWAAVRWADTHQRECRA